MKEVTFETVLAEKYNIHEDFVAEGNFVAYPDFKREPTELVSIGLSSRCLVVARMVLSGEAVDYELISLTPVSLLSLIVQNYSQRQIAVDSPFKLKTWVYQLCSSEDQDEVWEQFMVAIKKSYDQYYYCSSFRSAVTECGEPEAAVIIPSDSTTMIAPSLGCGVNNKVSATKTRKSASLPNIYPHSPNMPQEIRKTHSVESLFEYVKFDKFVNDDLAPTRIGWNTSNNANTGNGCASGGTETAFGKFKSSLKRLFQRNTCSRNG